MAEYFLTGKSQIELPVLVETIYTGDSSLGIGPFDRSVVVGVSVLSPSEIRIDTESPNTLTSRQLADLQTLIDNHVYVDLRQRQADAIDRQRQDDFFGLTRGEALQWITEQLETPTDGLSDLIDSAATMTDIKTILHSLRVLQVRHNRAIRKITEKLFDMVDMVDPTINKREGV